MSKKTKEPDAGLPRIPESIPAAVTLPNGKEISFRQDGRWSLHAVVKREGLSRITLPAAGETVQDFKTRIVIFHSRFAAV
ncbi:MAG: hypothetical protein JW913_16805 [Chitinispirillaceae bacterium]|nr:hypothetical protein [Chitinispirillaceae bacterium]